jgi:hypothetical protein
MYTSYIQVVATGGDGGGRPPDNCSRATCSSGRFPVDFQVISDNYKGMKK